MGHFFKFITHLVIIVTVIALVYEIIVSALRVQHSQERLFRFIAIAIGTLIYSGSKAVGMDIPSLMFQSISQIDLKFGFITVVCPSVAACATGWFLTSKLKNEQDQDIGARIITLITTLIVVMFSDVYIATYKNEAKTSLDLSLLPNLSFTISLGLYILLNQKFRKNANGGWQDNI